MRRAPAIRRRGAGVGGRRALLRDGPAGAGFLVAEHGEPQRDAIRTARQTRTSFFAVGQWASGEGRVRSRHRVCSIRSRRRSTANCSSASLKPSFWLMDVPAFRRFAGEAQVLADRVGATISGRTRWRGLASAKVSDGDVLGGIQIDREALAAAGGIRSFGLARTPLTLYWAGRDAMKPSSMASQAVERQGSRGSRIPAVRAPAPWAQPVRCGSVRRSGARVRRGACLRQTMRRASAARAGDIDVGRAPAESWRSRWAQGASASRRGSSHIVWRSSRRW